MSVFDFDGTLMNTPGPEEGKAMYSEIKGKPYPHNGWWSKKESLLPEYQIQPISSVLDEYHKIKSTDITILLTNRLPRLEREIRELLDFHEIFFDHYLFATADPKSKRLLSHLERTNLLPRIKRIECWDDMTEHVEDLDTMSIPGVTIIVNLV